MCSFDLTCFIYLDFIFLTSWFIVYLAFCFVCLFGTLHLVLFVWHVALILFLWYRLCLFGTRFVVWHHAFSFVILTFYVVLCPFGIMLCSLSFGIMLCSFFFWHPVLFVWHSTLSLCHPAMFDICYVWYLFDILLCPFSIMCCSLSF